MVIQEMLEKEMAVRRTEFEKMDAARKAHSEAIEKLESSMVRISGAYQQLDLLLKALKDAPPEGTPNEPECPPNDDPVPAGEQLEEQHPTD